MNLGLQEVEVECVVKNLIDEIKLVGPLICRLPRSLMIVVGLTLLSRIYVSLIIFLEAAYEANNYIDVIYWLEEPLPCIMSLIDSDVPVNDNIINKVYTIVLFTHTKKRCLY